MAKILCFLLIACLFVGTILAQDLDDAGKDDLFDEDLLDSLELNDDDPPNNPPIQHHNGPTTVGPKGDSQDDPTKGNQGGSNGQQGGHHGPRHPTTEKPDPQDDGSNQDDPPNQGGSNGQQGGHHGPRHPTTEKPDPQDDGNQGGPQGSSQQGPTDGGDDKGKDNDDVELGENTEERAVRRRMSRVFYSCSSTCYKQTPFYSIRSKRVISLSPSRCPTRKTRVVLRKSGNGRYSYKLYVYKRGCSYKVAITGCRSRFGCASSAQPQSSPSSSGTRYCTRVRFSYIYKYCNNLHRRCSVLRDSSNTRRDIVSVSKTPSRCRAYKFSYNTIAYRGNCSRIRIRVRIISRTRYRCLG